MRAGQLRHRITIEQRAAASPSKNNMGEDEYVWSTYWSCYASIRGVGRGKEQLTARMAESNVEVEVLIRYAPGITPQMRVLHGSQYYDIHWIDNDRERNQQLILYCSRGASLG